VRSYRQVLQSADVQASGILVDALGADGERHPALGLPYRLGDAPRATPGAAPACGADTDAVLQEIGLSADEIGELRRNRVVA